MKTKYTILLALTYFMVLTSCQKVSQQEETTNKPNVIIVITDDQGYGDLGFNGNKIIQTPAIDNFSTQAINLTNYHVSTTCAPTRGAMMTGRNPNRNGVWHTIKGASMLNGDELAMPEVFKQNGYSTAMFGKWHLGDNHPFRPHDKGFDVTFYHGGGGIGQTPDYWNNDYFDDTYFRNGVPEKQEGYCTDVWFSEAIKFIEDNKDKPFFTYLSLNAPHGPYNVPDEYYQKYADEKKLLEPQKRFYGMISNIDDNFKVLLAKLDELKIADNTIVIFTSDNGTAAGYKQNRKTKEYYGYNAGMRGTKASHYDGGHRVPFIIRWPNGKLTGGKQLNELIAHVDLLPTLTTFAGIDFKPVKEMDGLDVSTYLQKEEKPEDRMLVVDTQRLPWPKKGKQSCVMQGDWRLIDGKALYNISEDPGQTNDIATQYPDKVAAMDEFYNTWWDNMIKETKYSIINLGVDSVDVLTCHDAHTELGVNPPWNQSLIRKGNTMKPAKLLVNFTKDGAYKFDLSRWPEESGLALGASIEDAYPATKSKDKRINGKAIQFKKAHLKVGEKIYSVDVDNTLPSATIEAKMTKGNAELTAWFTTEDETETNAFYIYVEGKTETI